MDTAVVVAADQHQIPGRSVGRRRLRADVVAMQRCAGTIQPGGCSRYRRARPARHADLRGIPLRESDGQGLPVDLIGGEPHDQVDLRGAGVFGDLHPGHEQPEGQRSASPVLSWSGSR